MKTFKTEQGFLEYDIVQGGDTLYDRVLEEFELRSEESEETIKKFEDFCKTLKGTFYLIHLINTPQGGIFKFIKEIRKELKDHPIIGVAFPLVTVLGGFDTNILKNPLALINRANKLVKLYERFGLRVVYTIKRDSPLMIVSSET